MSDVNIPDGGDNEKGRERRIVTESFGELVEDVPIISHFSLLSIIQIRFTRLCRDETN